MDKLRIGLIGAWGLRGKLAKYAEDQFDEVSVVGAADINEASLQAFREYYGDHTFLTDNYRELLDRSDIDAVFIITPDYCHEEQTIAALQAGKHVYLEKPMAITTAGCDRILKAAFDTGTKLYLGHNMRYFPAVIKMKEIIDSGAIGEVRTVWCRHFVSIGGDAYFKDWHSEQKNSTGLLIQKGAHDIDVIHWLTGAYTTGVVGMGNLTVYNRTKRREEGPATVSDFPQKPDGFQVRIDESNWPPFEQNDFSPVIDVEDHNMILMQLENNIQASYMQCHYTPDYHRNYTFIGTEGRIENKGDSGNCSILLYNKRKDGYPEPNRVFTLDEVEGSHGGSDPAIVRSFVEFLLEGKIPNTSPLAARQAVAVGEAATKSLRANCSFHAIPPVDDAILDYFTRGQQS